MVQRNGDKAANGKAERPVIAETDKGEFEMRSDDPGVRAVVKAMQDAGEVAVADLKLTSPFDHITLAMALAALVWESGGRHERIATSAIKLLLNMAIDHGIAEQVGLVQMPGEGETVN